MNYVILQKGRGYMMLRYGKKYLSPVNSDYYIFENFEILGNTTSHLEDYGNYYLVRNEVSPLKKYIIHALSIRCEFFEFENDEAAKLYFEVME